jgi:hypothetical protein
VFWRSLTATLEHKDDPALDFNSADWDRMDEVEIALREFLLERNTHPQDIEHHLFNARSTTESDVPGINALLNLTSGYAIRGWNGYPDRSLATAEAISNVFASVAVLLCFVRRRSKRGDISSHEQIFTVHTLFVGRRGKPGQIRFSRGVVFAIEHLGLSP